MAQHAKLAALTDDLVVSLLQFRPEANRNAYRHAKELAARALRPHQYARPNQFDVQASFAGLDEKFRVLNRDDLADALDTRLKELAACPSAKWIPDCLSLLLLLSDRPTENSRVDALDLLRPPTPLPHVTWKDILHQDPYSDDEIWRDIDYAQDSSDDEPVLEKQNPIPALPPTSVDDNAGYNPESCLISIDSSMVEKIKHAQFWKHHPYDAEELVEMTELQAIRETLFMLSGLPTSLYLVDENMRLDQRYRLSHAMQITAKHLLVDIANLGRKLVHLRRWAQRSSTLPLIQTFEFAVRRRLTDFDRFLNSLQRQYLAADAPVVVSLMHLHEDVRAQSQPILRLAQIVADIEPQLLVNPFIHLEALYNHINLAQMTLEKRVFDFLSDLFFECLQTYLKPIRKWMETGELGLNDETFFIFENDSGSEASSLWHDRFVLRRGKENALRSPTFLEPAAQKIFNTGKSVIFLQELGIQHSEALGLEPRMDSKTVCGTSPDLPLSPFQDLFQAAFQEWIASKYSHASNVLRDYLFNESGLIKTLNDFRILYLGANGSVFQDFADAILERMDNDLRGWNDRFLLTELARGIFSPSLGQSAVERVFVRSARSGTQAWSVKGLVKVSLDYAVSKNRIDFLFFYSDAKQLPWPIMNIMQRSSVPIYQQVFAFLLQLYRAKYLLQKVSPQKIDQIKDVPLRQLGFKLRQQLMWFVDVLRSYLTETIIHSNFETMKAAMAKAEDIDEMSSIHIKYVARLQEQALLSENLKPIHKAITSLLDVAVFFTQSLHTDDFHGSEAQKKRMKPKSRTTPSKTLRRKSFLPSVVDESSDSDSSIEQDTDAGVDSKDLGLKAPRFQDNLKRLDNEFGRLLPFVIAGLRSVGRVGAEPVWEMLAERLEWQKRKGL